MHAIDRFRCGRPRRFAALWMLALLMAPAPAAAQTGAPDPPRSEERADAQAPRASLRVSTHPGLFPASVPQSAAGPSSLPRELAGSSGDVAHFPYAPVTMSAPTPSLRRHLVLGSGIGALAGAAFALAVVSLADCAGSHCTGEAVIGVAGHALAGGVVGALIGGVTYRIRG